MADTPEDRAPEALARRIPAYALLRATVANDMDAAVLLVRESVRSGRPDLLIFNMAAVAARALLASEGYDMAKVLATLDNWMETAANGVPSAEAVRQQRNAVV
jgi:hypothetical protein